jgi:hypothetical protein
MKYYHVLSINFSVSNKKKKIMINPFLSYVDI